MFTIKYRKFEPGPMLAPPPDANPGMADTPTFTPTERIDGPFDSVSQRWENGYSIVTCGRGDMSPGMTYGPVQFAGDGIEKDPKCPRPTLWVMNEQGATIAKYDL